MSFKRKTASLGDTTQFSTSNANLLQPVINDRSSNSLYADVNVPQFITDGNYYGPHLLFLIQSKCLLF